MYTQNKLNQDRPMDGHFMDRLITIGPPQNTWASTEHGPNQIRKMLLTLCSRKSTLAHRNFGEILEFLCFKNKLQQNICYHFTGLMINTTILFSATH